MSESGRYPDMSVAIGSLRMKNPVTAASGTFGFGREYDKLFDISELGGVMVKGTTLHPRQGNPAPRVAETPSGMLNSVGLQNPGVKSFVERELPWLRTKNIAVIVNISGNTAEEYGELAEILNDAEGVHGLEVNVSCPNVKSGGMAFGTTVAGIKLVTKTVRTKTALPIIVKLSPNVTDIGEMAKAAEGEGADSVSLINTLLGMEIDIRHRRPLFANTFAGLSGPAVMPVALRMVWQTYKAVKIPIIGMGGISSVDDAVKFIMAGARAVSIGTAGFVNPSIWVDVVNGLERFCSESGFESVGDMAGIAHNS